MTRFFDEPWPPFLPGEYRVSLAATAWERSGHHRLRRDVFCGEQGLFDGDDRDILDETAIPIIAATCVHAAPDQVVGAVRINQVSPGLWWGSRLAVDAAHRCVGTIGAELIRLAVSTANARGCTEFLAHVQARNARLFHRLHWETLEVVTLHGMPHHRMRASLPHYPPHGLSETRYVRPVRIRRPAVAPENRAA
jgi:putative N-acetyltransferase (TIGR04045 family)